MQKNDKSKKKSIDKLRMILDDTSGTYVHPSDEKYLKALKKRLDISSKNAVYVPKSYKKEGEDETDSLKPTVTIHLRDEDIVEFPEITMEEPKEEPSHKDDDLFEVEKVKVDSPEFIEVKPKETPKKEVADEEKFEEIKQLEPVEEKLPEWEPVKTEETVKKESEWENAFEEEAEKHEGKTFGVGEVWEDKDDKDVTFEKRLDNSEIISLFSEFKSVDDETAILLYNNGFKSVGSLMIATIKDLTKIKGIKKKIAKKIIKEIDEKKKIGPENSEDFFKEEIIDKDEFQIDEKIVDIEPENEEVFMEEQYEELTMEEPEPGKLDENQFESIKSIDGKIAKLLQENGINSIEMLRETTIKQLTKIKGIKRKVAKKIKKEVDALSIHEETTDDDWKIVDMSEGKADEFEEFDEAPTKQKMDIISEEDEDDWGTFKEEQGYKYSDYTLYEKEIEGKTGKKRTVRFFSKEKPDEGEPIDLPKGYEVKENKKTGVPYLKKKR